MEDYAVGNLSRKDKEYGAGIQGRNGRRGDGRWKK
jgi:hypothetical protein